MTPSNFRSPLSGERKYFFCIALSAGEKGITELCPFCPYEMRSMSRKGRELCPNGAKREARYSGAALRAHAVVSPLKFSAESSLLLFCPAKEKQRNPALCLPFLTKGRHSWWVRHLPLPGGMGLVQPPSLITGRQEAVIPYHTGRQGGRGAPICKPRPAALPRGGVHDIIYLFPSNSRARSARETFFNSFSIARCASAR